MFKKVLKIPSILNKEEEFWITPRGYFNSLLLTAMICSSIQAGIKNTFSYLFPQKPTISKVYPSENGQYEAYKKRIEKRYLWIRD